MAYVYLMESHGRYKIGKAEDLGDRLNTFRTADPEIALIHAIHTRDAYGLEARLHEQFNARRLWPDREWFDLRPEHVAYIKSIEGGFRPRRWCIRWRRLGALVRGLIIPIMAAIVLYLLLREPRIMREVYRLPQNARYFAIAGAWLLIWFSLRSLIRSWK